MYNICFCINDLYSQHLGVVLTSILENNKNGYFKFNILTNDISNANKLKLKSLYKKYKNFDIEYFNIEKNLFSSFNLTINYISLETYFRYLLPNIFPRLDKILYLDVDLIVNKDISKLFEIDISQYYCAGVEDINFDTNTYKKTIGLDDNTTYINAGVILFNLAKMRKDNIVQKFFNMHKQYAEKIKYQDQDIINIVLSKNILPIDKKYNCTTRTLKNYPELRKYATIIHYVGPNKPWKRVSFNRLKILYYYYRMKSPYFM